MVENGSSIVPKSSKNLCCDLCDYNTSRQSQYDRHLATAKHQQMENDSKMVENGSSVVPKSSNFQCICGKIYKYDSGFYRHKKACDFKEPTTQTNNTAQLSDTNKQLTTAILQIVTNNDEFKKIILEQNKQLMELAKSSNPQIGNNNNINSHNKFNINVFLNEKCKDALNISDFVSQLNIGVKDLEETGRLGFADGISKIFINGLNQLDIYNKPLHCNDAKREVLYIKDSDKWTKEEDGKPILTKAIKEVASKNIKQIFEWQKLHSEYNDPRSKQNDKYLQIVCESMSGSTKEESEKNYNKIIRKLAKETVIPEIEK